jgi:prepilin-type N-terminal cleavage/methylation domain-containing protein
MDKASANLDTTAISQEYATDTPQFTICNSQFAICDRSSAPRRGFTLVELLVVITIIGILASLILVAANGALKRAHQAQIKTELDQLDMAIQHSRDNSGSYPPNCQTDGAGGPLDENQAFTDLKRYMKQAFPRSRESDNLLRLLVGLTADSNSADQSDYPRPLSGGITAGEAVVFWLGGFSSDPKYPISGDGGPAYDITSSSIGNLQNRTLEPLGRKWVFPFATTRLLPRKDSDNYFDESTKRYIEYTSPITINGVRQLRRINFWQYVPAKSVQPYLYFDASRHQPDIASDPPAATATTGLGAGGLGLQVYAIKKAADSANSTLPVQYANADKYQILHAGIDDEWDDDDPMATAIGGLKSFGRMSYQGLKAKGIGSPTQSDFLVYPTGPFTGEAADTIVNFSESTLAGSQK